MKDIEKSFVYHINYTAKSLMHVINRKANEHGYAINMEQLQILMISYLTKGCIQQDLANILDKNKSAILRSVDVLERKGFITRLHSEKDKRINILQPTEQGILLALDLEKKMSEYEQELIENIDPQELEITIKVLKQIQENSKCSQI